MTPISSPAPPRIGLEIAPESGVELLNAGQPLAGIDYLALRHRPSSRHSLEDLLIFHSLLTSQLGMPILLHLPLQRIHGLSNPERKAYFQHLASTSPSALLAIHGDDHSGGEVPLPAMCRFLSELRSMLPASRILVAGHPRTLHDSSSRMREQETLQKKVQCGVDGILTQMLSSPTEYTSYTAFTAAAIGSIPVIPGIPLAPTLEIAEKFQLELSGIGLHDTTGWTAALATDLAHLHPDALHFFGTGTAMHDIDLLQTAVLPRIRDGNRDIVQSLNADDT